MSTARRSAIWNVFTETHKSDYIATCNICSQEFSYRSTTTNLMKHLKRKHPGVSLETSYSPDKLKHVEIVIERELENECEVKTFKVEVKGASEEENEFIVLNCGKKVSSVWDYFRKIPNSDYAALCNYCNKEFSYRTTTSNLKKHMHRKHSQILTEIPQLQNFQDVPQEQSIYNSSKDIENIENNPNPPINNSDLDNDFWDIQDNSDDDPEFRPSPSPVGDDFELKTTTGKKRSQIWNVFTEKPGSDYIALCNVCQQEFCYRSTTNNLKKHFQRKHPELNFENKIGLVKPELESQDQTFNIKNNDSSDEEKDEDFVEKSSKRKPSQIWNYFTKKKSSDYIATCNICRKELGYRSTTSNLRKHLDRKHPHVQLIKTEVEEQKKDTPEVPIKTCLICLEPESNDTSDFTQVNSCDPENKSYMNKIQEVMNQPVDIDESHVLCHTCIDELDKILQFKDKIMKAFEFWSKMEPEPEPEPESETKQEMECMEVSADDEVNHSDYSDFEDGESLAKFTCSKCNKEFPSPSVMLKHNCDQPSKKDKVIEKREKTDVNHRFYCEHCGRGFSIKWKLTKHLKQCPSKVVKQFVCTMCDRVFKKAYHLREHMASHTGERNYSCNICGKTFQRCSSKHKHIRSHSAKPGEKSKKTPFLCTICGKSFPYSNGASRHMRVHLGEKRHECHICMKKFSQTTHLKVHLRTHSGERPYGCMICGRSFSLNASLRKHMRLHVGSGELVKLVKNLETNLETNLDNLGNNLVANLGTTLETIETQMEPDLDGNLGESVEPDIETDIAHVEVVTEDGIQVLTHHEINLEGNECAG